jgi:hypothetical protein
MIAVAPKPLADCCERISSRLHDLALRLAAPIALGTLQGGITSQAFSINDYGSVRGSRDARRTHDRAR